MVRVLGSAGVIKPHRPTTLARLGASLVQWGTGVAGGFTAMAILHPDRTAVADELGDLTYGQLHERSNRLAGQLKGRGGGPDGSGALMFRNHRGVLDASVAPAQIGAHNNSLHPPVSRP